MIQLQELRKRQNLTQVDVAALSGLGRSTISRLEESSGIDPRWSSIVEYAAAIGYGVDLTFTQGRVPGAVQSAMALIEGRDFAEPGTWIERWNRWGYLDGREQVIDPAALAARAGRLEIFGTDLDSHILRTTWSWDRVAGALALPRTPWILSGGPALAMALGTAHRGEPAVAYVTDIEQAERLLTPTREERNELVHAGSAPNASWPIVLQQISDFEMIDAAAVDGVWFPRPLLALVDGYRLGPQTSALSDRLAAEWDEEDDRG